MEQAGGLAMRDCFILGCERSGSTWLANIFEAHPDVELVMEPCADYAKLFPAVAERNTCLGADAQRACAELREGYAKLAAARYPLVYRPGAPVWLARLEQRALGELRRAGLSLLGRSWPWLDRHQLLNLHAASTPVALLARKRRAPALRVTKELRLNFKVPLLLAFAPAARFLVALRHPVAQVASIDRWMQRGRLRELARALDAFEVRIAAQQQRFGGLAAACPAGDTAPERLARWWALNYSVLLEDLDRNGAFYRVVRHEELARRPGQQATALLRFAGLDPAASVDRYVAWSSSTAPRLGTAVETVRHSEQHVLEALRSAPTDVALAVARALEGLERAKLLHGELARYLDELEV